MPRAYSSDLRERLTAAVTAGMSRNEAADVFSVAISTAVKWMQRLRDTGSAAAKPSGGSTSPLEQHKERILAVVRERPDATLKEILAALRKAGIHTSKSALDRFLARHKITRKKKSLLAAEQKRKDVARARRKWIREQGFLDPAHTRLFLRARTHSYHCRRTCRCDRLHSRAAVGLGRFSRLCGD
jgi:transposase